MQQTIHKLFDNS
ncbi:unnamed protein product [Oppiella nova]|uniref:Uncharacterized protein n=1 Tax=Oppiella nova TaxID=334625 RepID=A0A7R9MSR9_9ACAR|nr:unnamed protein product [Oppiella nova]CAG2182966.1 unnamed protein product [Oppiella nova]